MKAIVIKLNDQVIFCESVKDLTLFKYNDLHKEAIKNIGKKDEHIVELEATVDYLKAFTKELEAKINYLGKQIAIDRGEIDADSEEEYEIVVQRKEESVEEVVETEPEQPQEESEVNE